MLLYCAFAWEERNPAAHQEALWLLSRFQDRSPEWNVEFQVEGLAVSCRIEKSAARLDQRYRLATNKGIVLGKLFDRESTLLDAPGQVVFDEEVSASIIRSQGRQLVRDYWGRYIAFLRNPGTHTTWVVRDPSGSMNCYMTRVGEVDIFFLRLEDIERLDAFQTSISRRGVIAHTALTIQCARVTGLNEVTSLLAGECIRLHDSERSHSFYWNPLEIAKNDVIEEPGVAEEALRQAVRSCVHAWASCFDTVVHNLSGGLDSAIVLACLRDAPSRPNIICRTLYGRSSSAQDERQYARLAAKRAGFSLVETPLSGRYYFCTDEGPPAPDPYFPMILESDEDWMRALTRRSTHIPGSFSGEGGDELFFHGAPRTPAVADYLYRHGLHRRAWRIALEDAELDRVALWRVVRAGALQGLLHRRPFNCRKHQWFLRQQHPLEEFVPHEILEEAYGDDMLWHPLFLNDIADVPPGKAYHCFILSFASEPKVFTPPPPDRLLLPAHIEPLRSQPLIEVSLRIPTYVLRSGARDRAIARRAFAHDLPEEILWRKSKGGGNEALHAALRRNLSVVRHRLLDGVLVQKGYLDGTILAEGLELDNPTRRPISLPLLCRHFLTEKWIEHWPGYVPPAYA